MTNSLGSETARSEDGADNVATLIGRLTSQSAHLAQQHVNLVQAEMRESVTDIQKSIAGLLGAAVFGIAGLGVTLMGIAYLIGDAINDRDLATLLVGVATLILAGVLYASARSKMAATNLKPHRTIETVERDVDAARGDLSNPGAKQ